jgi:hypothetical protein
VTQPDIVKQLQRDHPDAVAYILGLQEQIDELRQKLFDLGEELQIWQDRYEAEKQDHEATMKAWDEERSGL